MRCLLCDKEKIDSDVFDIFSEDMLCHECRNKWEKKENIFRFEGKKLRSSYVYNEPFADALLQYKECYDEALKDIFLYEVKNKLKLIYRGYTMVLMPSSTKKEEERGFSHLKLMFSSLKLPMIEPFIKIDERSQKGTNVEERKKITNSIKLKKGIILPNKLLLVDDVITTGATLSTAIALLPSNNKDIQIYTVSYSKMWL